MSDEHTVLLLGGTGRTGRRVLGQLLGRGVSVRAIVRSASRLPEGAAGNPRLTVIVADLLSLSDDELRHHVAGCDAVVSCLGHTISLKGIFGSPRNLVERAVVRVCGAVKALRPAEPIRLILMSSVSVNRPGRFDARRGRLERAVVWVLRGLLPPPGTTSGPPTSSATGSARETPSSSGWPSAPTRSWRAMSASTLSIKAS